MDFITDLLSNTLGEIAAIGLISLLGFIVARHRWGKKIASKPWRTRLVRDGDDPAISCAIEVWKKSGILESELAQSEELAHAIFETNESNLNPVACCQELLWVTEQLLPTKMQCVTALGGTYDARRGLFFISAFGIDPDYQLCRPDNPLNDMYRSVLSYFNELSRDKLQGLVFEIEDWRRMNADNPEAIKTARDRERRFARTFHKLDKSVRALDLPYVQPPLRPTQLNKEDIPLLICIHLTAWNDSPPPRHLPLEQAAAILDFLTDSGYIGVARYTHEYDKFKFDLYRKTIDQIKMELLPQWYKCDPTLRKFLGDTLSLHLLEGSLEAIET